MNNNKKIFYISSPKLAVSKVLKSPNGKVRLIDYLKRTNTDFYLDTTDGDMKNETILCFYCFYLSFVVFKGQKLDEKIAVGAKLNTCYVISRHMSGLRKELAI